MKNIDQTDENIVIGKTISHFKIIEKLGAGGMGEVYLAEDTRLDRKVALKFLPPHFTADTESLARFEREAKATAALNHPNIITVYEIGDHENQTFIAMEYVEGESLRERMAKKLSLSEILELVTQICSGLGKAHEADVVHRDIKPENIMIDKDGRVRILDFGLAKLKGATKLTREASTLGTLNYMSPEQFQALVVDHRADIWSLGVILYELITGEVPFAGEYEAAVMYSVLNEDTASITSSQFDVPDQLEQVVNKALVKDPDERYQQVDELVVDVRRMEQEVEAKEASGSKENAGNFKLSAKASTTKMHLFNVSSMRAWTIWVLPLIIMSLLVIIWKPWQSQNPNISEKIDANVVVVLPFRVTGADASLAYLGEGLMDLLSTKLTGEVGPRAIDPAFVMSKIRSMSSSRDMNLTQSAAAKLAQNLGAGKILKGSVVGTSDQILVSATLHDETRNSEPVRATVEGRPNTILALIDQLTVKLLSLEAGEHVRRLSELTSLSLPAIRFYLAGRSKFRRAQFEQALKSFQRALTIDTTFALAALELENTTGWVGGTSQERVRARALAWAAKDRLSDRDRALLIARVGPRYPLLATGIELLDAREKALRMAPEEARSWFLVADIFFHYSTMINKDIQGKRTTVLIQRAIEIDSFAVGQLSHGISHAYRVGDTSRVSHYGRVFLRRLPEGQTAAFARWLMALAFEDTTTLDKLAGDLNSMSTSDLRWIAINCQDVDGLRSADAMRCLEVRSTRTGTIEEQLERRMGLHSLALNRGRPRVALRYLEEAREYQKDPQFHLRMQMLDALYSDGEQAAAVEAAAKLSDLVDAAYVRDDDIDDSLFHNIIVLEQWRLVHENSRTGQRSINTLKEFVKTHGPDGPDGVAALSIKLLEALLAVKEQRADAVTKVNLVDSTMMTCPIGGVAISYGHPQYWNIAITRMRLALGDSEGALAATRRRIRSWGWQPFVSTQLWEQGRLAARVGHHEEAIKAYKHYLGLRNDASPELANEVARIRQELARLEKKSIAE